MVSALYSGKERSWVRVADCIMALLSELHIKKRMDFRAVGNVLVGVRAAILGPVRIGDNVKVGANSVVITDVSPGAAVVGVLARVIPESADALDYEVKLG